MSIEKRAIFDPRNNVAFYVPIFTTNGRTAAS